MNLKKKVLPLAMTLLLGVGSIGIANAAAPVDFQQKVAAWIQNDPNPMPMNMNTNTNSSLGATTPSSTATTTPAANTSSPAVDITAANSQTPAPAAAQQSGSTASTPTVNTTTTNNQTPAPAVTQQSQTGNQQMMNNMTPEQMLQMDKAWAEAMSKNQTNPSGANSSYSWNSTSGGQNWNCGW